VEEVEVGGEETLFTCSLSRGKGKFPIYVLLVLALVPVRGSSVN